MASECSVLLSLQVSSALEFSGYQAPTLPALELLLLLCKMTAIWAGGLSVATTFQPLSHLPSLGSHSPDPSEQDQTGFGSCSPRSGAGTAEEMLLESRLPSGTFSHGLRLPVTFFRTTGPLLAALPRATLKESFPAQPKAIHPLSWPWPARVRFSCDPLCSQFPYSLSMRICFGAEVPGHQLLHLPLLPMQRFFNRVAASRPVIPRVPAS